MALNSRGASCFTTLSFDTARDHDVSVLESTTHGWLWDVASGVELSCLQLCFTQHVSACVPREKAPPDQSAVTFAAREKISDERLHTQNPDMHRFKDVCGVGPGVQGCTVTRDASRAQAALERTR